MNRTQAKILVMCDNLDSRVRYAEYIAMKLEMNYNVVSLYMRKMKHKEWITVERRGNKKTISTISMVFLEQAKKLLEKEAKKDDSIIK